MVQYRAPCVEMVLLSVEVDFYCDHVDGWGAAVARVRYAIAADC